MGGVALDDLQWATATQFRRHYNASHPLVAAAIRRNSRGIEGVSLQLPLEEAEFMAALPRYPNDGVLLLDVQRYNDWGLFQQADAIALANARGENAVGLGTQQFTVLTMHDRWVELTPRANLRHFPGLFKVSVLCICNFCNPHTR